MKKRKPRFPILYLFFRKPKHFTVAESITSQTDSRTMTSVTFGNCPFVCTLGLMNAQDVSYARFLSTIPEVARHYEWRYGQALFNLLTRVRPSLAEAVRATPIDPFYREQDDIATELWEMLESRWDEATN